MSRSRTASLSGIGQHLPRGRGSLARQLHDVWHVTVLFQVSAQHFDSSAISRQRDSRPRLQRPHVPVDVEGTDLPLELTVLTSEPRRQRRTSVVLLATLVVFYICHG